MGYFGVDRILCDSHYSLRESFSFVVDLFREVVETDVIDFVLLLLLFDQLFLIIQQSLIHLHQIFLLLRQLFDFSLKNLDIAGHLINFSLEDNFH